MNESHKYKLVFFHLPKNAGVSVRRAIGIDKKHKFPQKCFNVYAIDVRYITNDEIYNSYHKFSIVRNPFERMVSLYSFRKNKEICIFIGNLFDSDLVQMEKFGISIVG